jgi:hypothetical protein
VTWIVTCQRRGHFVIRNSPEIEAGRPFTLKTLLRICDVFEVTPETLLRGFARKSAGELDH